MRRITGGRSTAPQSASQSGSTGSATPTELINNGVSIEVRRRLGHASTETTQVYTLLAGQVADAEIRAARRRRESRR